jgi:3',5'-cyclic AMP phosphodiesterase CpdA
LTYAWRNLRGLGFLLAMLTDYGRVARFGGRPPVWLDGPPAQPALRIAHLSDLHLVEEPMVRLVERPRPGGNAILPALLDTPALAEAEALVLTGDITDRGTSLAWRAFLDLVEARGLAERVVLVPGNHDLAFLDAVSRQRPWRHDRFGIVQLANLLKFGEAFAATGGGRRGVVLSGDAPTPYLVAWEAVEREVRPLVAALPTLPVPPLGVRHYYRQRGPRAAYRRRIEAARARLFGLFPVAVPIGERAVVFVVNSCAGVSLHPATNALGHVGRAQYRRLERLAAAFPDHLKLVALHHHVVRRLEEASSSFVHRLMAKFTVLGDARPLVRFCRRHGVRAVLNGHRHLSYQLRLGCGTVLLAAPSSTLGDELSGDPRPQFERYDFAADGDGAALGAAIGVWRAPVRLTSPRPR